MEEKKLLRKLGKTWAGFRLEHPNLEKSLDGGLLILLAGGVASTAPWTARTSRAWPVSLTGVHSTRWSCRCPQGASFGPEAEDFANRPGRICKHVAAVVMGLDSRCWPVRPLNLLEFLRRVAWLGEPVEVCKAMASPVAIPRSNGKRAGLLEDGDDVFLRLVVWGKRSGPLVRLADGEIVGDYAGWVEKVKGESNETHK